MCYRKQLQRKGKMNESKVSIGFAIFFALALLAVLLVAILLKSLLVLLAMAVIWILAGLTSVVLYLWCIDTYVSWRDIRDYVRYGLLGLWAIAIEISENEKNGG